jgi:hypothetical protein
MPNTYILEMSTDEDIIQTAVKQGFPGNYLRHSWKKVIGFSNGYPKLNIPDGSTIVVIAHGNSNVIGNANDEDVTLTPEAFLATIFGNMSSNQSAPAEIYISACGEKGLALFGAAVAITCSNNDIYGQATIYGHGNSIEGDVPNPKNLSWTPIYVSKKRRVSTSLERLSSGMLFTELQSILQADNQQKFQDSDGLIAFINLSTSFVTSNKEFTVGRDVCDKVSNFFATMRNNTFSYLKKNPKKVLPGDGDPNTQWDLAVTHYMQYLLTEAGGFTNYKITTENYSVTQIITEFSTDFIKLIFDAAVVPTEVIDAVVKFVQGVGQSLKTSWNDKSKQYQTCLLAQCHEGVPTNNDDKNFVYFPKIKYYYVSIDSSQTAFISNCAKVEKITFNFKYEYYATGLRASILDKTSKDYKNFVAFLDKAQQISYQDADNKLDEILNNTVSSDGKQMFEAVNNPFGVDLLSYPETIVKPPKVIENILNHQY